MKQASTLFVDLCAGQSRDLQRNSGTRLTLETQAVAADAARSCFVHHYNEIRCLYRSKGRDPGVLAVAIGPGGITACASLAARPGRATSAIIGRHAAAPIYLHHDPALSLRHLALVVHPLGRGGLVRYRLLDLRTSTAFADETGKRLSTLEAEGPTFVRVGHYWLLLLVGGDDTPWPLDAGDGWACIPERVYFDEHSAEIDRWQREQRRRTPRADIEQPCLPRQLSAVWTSVAPLAFADERHVADDEAPAGALYTRSAKGDVSTIVVGSSALRAGVLLGRSSRCEGSGGPFAQRAISRVHVLLLQIDGIVYAIDTASSNGVSVNGSRVFCSSPLRHGDWMRIGTVEAQWRSTTGLSRDLA
jgi:hypothetical protein